MPEAKEEKKVPEALKIYEDGKQRRYALLFAVNGGKFAIAKELYGHNPASLGLLSSWLISVGMIAFTILMVYDIWAFAMKMRKDYSLDVFQDQKVGQILLVFI